MKEYLLIDVKWEDGEFIAIKFLASQRGLVVKPTKKGEIG
jgi:hypothetical protein